MNYGICYYRVMKVSKSFTFGIVSLMLLGHPAGAATVPLIVSLRTSDVEVRGRKITLSPHFQVALEFAQAVDLVSGNNTSVVKVTVPEAPQDRFLLLDPLVDKGSVTLNVVTGGRMLPLTLVIDSKATTGTRKYIFVEDVSAGVEKVAATSTPLDPSTSVPALKTSVMPLTGTVGTQAAASADDSALNIARNNLAQALDRLSALKTAAPQAAAPPQTRVKVTMTAALDGNNNTDQVKLTLKNAGDRDVVFNGDDLQLWVGGRALSASVADVQLAAGETQVVPVELGLKLAEGDTLKVIWLATSEGQNMLRLESQTAPRKP